jgi:L-ascorbate metabolism protein UlaG (beta-lactamase superfamily)
VKKKVPESNLLKHFNGKFFYNQFPKTKKRKLRDVFYWLLFRKATRWPKQMPQIKQKIPEKNVKGQQIRVTFINHSTLLIQARGVNILTDPIWSERCSPFKLWGPRRVAVPGVKFKDLPSISHVLISHNHYDHMDLPTLKLLNQKHNSQFFVSLGNLKYLRKNGINEVSEMDWGQEAILSPHHLKIIFVPAQHTSGRGLFDQNKTLWGGYLLEFQNKRIYFAGDTGYGLHFKYIREKYGPIDLAILPIGAYLPRWFMSPVHMSPQEAVKAHLDLEASQSIAIHFGTFLLSDESIEAPINELKAALREHKIPLSKFVALNHGEQVLL